VLAALLAGGGDAAGACPDSWPLWNAYVERFISSDGRAIDSSAGGISTSEGQSYALFFSLVANDRALFRRLYDWTRDNLAGGRLDARLPAYKWGRRGDGSWGGLDDNSAADSDLWIGYTLIEAGRLWSDAELTRTGRALLENVVAREVARLPGLGAMLLPAPRGFVHGRSWRLNPSYLPLQLLQGLASEGVPGPWGEIRTNTIRMIEARATRGFIDDWVGYEPRAGFVADPVHGAIGSYDAIRVYLWQALLDPRDRAGAQLGLDGIYDYWHEHGRVPERIDTRRPSANVPAGPVGFLAVLLPRVARSADEAERARLVRELESVRDGRLYGRPPTYYDQNLILFAQGFIERRYRFAVDGRVVPAWSEVCAPTGTRDERPR
jgi:endo-1,4-beta-D-glucanase Y